MSMISALFWEFIQPRMVITYPSFGTNYRLQLQGQKVREEIIDCPETSVRNYPCTLLKVSEERRYHYFSYFGCKKQQQIFRQHCDPKPSAFHVYSCNLSDFAVKFQACVMSYLRVYNYFTAPNLVLTETTNS